MLVERFDCGIERTTNLLCSKLSQATACGKPDASAVQAPLILGYGLTVCKAQGLTLGRAVLSLDGPGFSGRLALLGPFWSAQDKDIAIGFKKDVSWQEVVRACEQVLNWLRQITVSSGWLRLEAQDRVSSKEVVPAPRLAIAGSG
jgi:hypothetical protein